MRNNNLSPAQRAQLLKWKLPFLIKEVKRRLNPLGVLYIDNSLCTPGGQKNFTPVPWFLIGKKLCFPVFVGCELFGFVVVPCALSPLRRKEVRDRIDRFLNPYVSPPSGEEASFSLPFSSGL